MKLNTRRQGEITVIELEGHLDFEATQLFLETASDILQKSETAQVVFNFSKLKFVGSSGISQFIKALKKLNSTPAKPKLCSLSSEFLRMFKAYQTVRNPLQIFDDEVQAVASFSVAQPARVTRKKKEVSN